MDQAIGSNMCRQVVPLLVLFGLIQPLAAQRAYKMKELAHYNNPNLRSVGGAVVWNDLTTYYDAAKNREYVIAGSVDSTYFFDITNASVIDLVSVQGGKSFFCQNRDYAIYQHYVYCVSDVGSGVGALQIFDLQYLPDSVHKVYESNTLGTFVHTIFADTGSGRIYLCSNTKPGGFSAMDILSAANPEHPVLLAQLAVPKGTTGTPLFDIVHEMYVRHDTAYLSCGTKGLFIFDLRDVTQQQLITSITSYPYQDFNHSSWLDGSGRYLLFTDEKSGMDAKIYDLQKFTEPRLVSHFNSHPQAIPHNAYWYKNLAYVSSYHDGVRIYNLQDPFNPQQVAWFNTNTDSPVTYTGFKGCWGVDPFLPSRHIVASDMLNGIFVLELDSTINAVEETGDAARLFSVYPNPCKDILYIDTGNQPQEALDFKLFTASGQLLLHSSMEGPIFETDLRMLASGIYFVRLGNTRLNQHIKIIKSN